MESLMSVLPSTFSIPVGYLKNYSQQMMRLYSDKTGDAKANDSIRFKLPNTVVDLKTLNFNFTFTAVPLGIGTTNVQNRYFPRLSSSIINSLSVYINGVLIENIQNYNQLFCLLYDAQSTSTTSSIRYQENNDPSFVSSVADSGAITNTIQGKSDTATIDTSKKFTVRSWLGFLGSCNTAIIDISKIGEVVLEFNLAQNNILWKGNVPTGTVVSTNTGYSATPDYSIKDYFITINRIAFGDNLYSSFVDNLISTGRYKLTYLTYLSGRSSVLTKGSSMSMSMSVNADTMTKVIATALTNDYTTESFIQNGSDATARALTLAERLTKVNTTNYEDNFNNSIYFKKDFVSLKSSQLTVNGVPQTPYALALEDIYNENLNILGSDSDLKACGHPGAYSLASWSKFYAYHLTSFSHRVASKEDIISGYDSKNSSISIKWDVAYETTASGSVYLMLFVEKYNQLILNENRQLQLIQ
jgi:hypothetical protein